MRKQDTWPERPRRNKLKAEDIWSLSCLPYNASRATPRFDPNKHLIVSLHYFLHVTIPPNPITLQPQTNPPRDAQDGELVHYPMTCLYQLYDAQDQHAPVFDSTLSSVSLVNCVDIKLQSVKC
jgi:hypothetical protein